MQNSQNWLAQFSPGINIGYGSHIVFPQKKQTRLAYCGCFWAGWLLPNVLKSDYYPVETVQRHFLTRQAEEALCVGLFMRAGITYRFLHFLKRHKYKIARTKRSFRSFTSLSSEWNMTFNTTLTALRRITSQVQISDKKQAYRIGKVLPS